MSKSSFSLSVGAVAMLLLSSMVVVIKAQSYELIYEQSIRTNKKCYLRGEPIYINFINQDWKTDDWVGIYPANTRLNDLTLSTLKMWVWTCGSQDRQCKVEYATVKLESLRDARLNNWPLRNGKYMAVLGRNGDEPYTHIVNSAAFSVENSCNGITLSPNPSPVSNDDDDDDDDDDNDESTPSPLPLQTRAPVTEPTPSPTRAPVTEPTPSPTRAPVTEPTPSPHHFPTNSETLRCPELPTNGCSVCGVGKCVSNAAAIFDFPGQPKVGCGILQQAGISGSIPLGQCKFLPDLIGACECSDDGSNGPIGIFPVGLAPQVTPPSISSSLPPIDDDNDDSSCPDIPDDGCSVCGEGKCVGNSMAVFSFPGQPAVPCGTLQEAGIIGEIPLDQCDFLSPLIEICECEEK